MSRRRTTAADLPLLRWGEEMRVAMMRRQRRRRVLATAAVAAGALVATTVWRPAARLIWNASASVPVGLYAVDRLDNPRRGDLVVARLVEPYRTFAAGRG